MYNIKIIGDKVLYLNDCWLIHDSTLSPKHPSTSPNFIVDCWIIFMLAGLAEVQQWQSILKLWDVMGDMVLNTQWAEIVVVCQ